MTPSLLISLLQPVAAHNFSIRFWDGSSYRSGTGQPEFTLTFHKPPSFVRGTNISRALGDAYMLGNLEIEGSFDAVARALEDFEQRSPDSRTLSARILGWFSASPRKSEQENIKAHYDLGNEFFSLWLDPSLCYSCAYFEGDDPCLEKAQQRKIELVLRKLCIAPGMRLLDIGCGWGHLAISAAKGYGARVVGITLSEEQAAGARQRVRDMGLEDRVEIRLQNYRELDESHTFDRISSIGMLEHVGQANLPAYFRKVAALLRPGGVSLQHSLVKHRESATNEWIANRIFPGGYIPSLREVIALLPEYGLMAVHAESLRRHYARTLESWLDTYHKPEVLQKVEGMFGAEFNRMWSLYLNMSAASLRVGCLDIFQVLCSKGPADDLPMTLTGIYNGT